MGKAKRRQRLNPKFGWVCKRLSKNVSHSDNPETEESRFLKINEGFENLGISDDLRKILAEARECNILDSLTLAEHIWHQIVTDGTEVSYLMVAVTCMAISMKLIIPDENMFPGDFLTFLSGQSRGESKSANKLAIKLIHAPLRQLVSY